MEILNDPGTDCSPDFMPVGPGCIYCIDCYISPGGGGGGGGGGTCRAQVTYHPYSSPIPDPDTEEYF